MAADVNEAEKLHDLLLMKLHGYIFPGPNEYNSILTRSRAYLIPAEVYNAKTSVGNLFESLEKNGHLGVGKYKVLKWLVEGNEPVLGIIKEYEDKITTALTVSKEHVSHFVAASEPSAEKTNHFDDEPMPSTSKYRKTEKSIQESYALTVESWKVEDLVFLETRGTKSVKDAIRKRPVVTVVGRAGAGKSATIHHIALEFKNNGYDILPVRTPDEIYKYNLAYRKQIFVIDDPIGIHGLSREKYMNWVEYDNILRPYLSAGNTKVLCSIRKQVANEPEFNSVKCLLNDCLIAFEDDQNKLRDKEKIQMIKNHLKFKQIDLRITDEAKAVCKRVHELFPLSCKLFSSNKDFRRVGWNFFKNPFKVILEDLKKIQCADRVKYCALVLCFAYENSLDAILFDPFEDKNLRHKAQPYITVCELTDDVLCAFLPRALDSLNGVYLHREGGLYSFSHDLIQDVVAYDFGKKHPKQLIELSTSKFICSRLFVNEEMAPKDDPYVIVITPNHFGVLLERLIADLEKGILNHVMMNKCWDDEKFIKVFIDFFIVKNAKADMVKIFIQNHDRYVHEIQSEIEVMKEYDPVKTWSWYYTAMQMLTVPDVTALHWMVTFSHKELFHFIWRHLSSEQKEQVREKVPLLHLACIGEDKGICEILLTEEGDKLHTPYYEDSSTFRYELPLSIASSHKSVDIVKLLIAHGADINVKKESTGSTALFYAAAYGNVDVLQVLIDHGADVNACDNTGDSPLIVAAQNNHVNIAQILIDNKAEKDHCSNSSLTALMIASLNNSAEMVDLLLKHGCDVNKCDTKGWPALIFASQSDSAEIVKLLINHGCDVNKCDNEKWSALKSAVANDNTEIVKLLLDHGCDANEHDDRGFAVLMSASQNNNTEIVTLLLDHGCDINMQADNGYTALIIASRMNNVEVVKLLLKSNCDVNICNNDGNSAEMIAQNFNFMDIIEAFQTYWNTC